MIHPRWLTGGTRVHDFTFENLVWSIGTFSSLTPHT